MDFDREKVLHELRTKDWTKYWKKFSDNVSPRVEENRRKRIKSLAKAKGRTLK